MFATSCVLASIQWVGSSLKVHGRIRLRGDGSEAGDNYLGLVSVRQCEGPGCGSLFSQGWRSGLLAPPDRRLLPGQKGHTTLRARILLIRGAVSSYGHMPKTELGMGTLDGACGAAPRDRGAGASNGNGSVCIGEAGG